MDMKWRRRLAVGCGLLACLFIGVAVALPRFVRFADRPVQSECTYNLKSWFVAERTQYQGFNLHVKKLGFVPERGNRYAYFSGPGPIEDRSQLEARGDPDVVVGFGVDTFKRPHLQPITLEQLPADVARLAGMHGSQCPQGPDCSITALCAANLDDDATLDVMSMSTVDRTGPDGQTYVAGQVMPLVDDTKQ